MLKIYLNLTWSMFIFVKVAPQSPRSISLPEASSSIVRTFHSGFNGSYNLVSLASRDNLCTLSQCLQSILHSEKREKWICQDCSRGWWIIFPWDVPTIYPCMVTRMASGFLFFSLLLCFMHVCGSAHFARIGRSLVAYQFHRRLSRACVRSPVSCSVYSAANRLED